MTNLIKDYYEIIEFDEQVAEVLGHLTLDSMDLSDDDGTLNLEYKQDDPFVYNVLKTAQFLIANTYLYKYYKTIEYIESKIIKGVTDNVLEWHNDRLCLLSDIEAGKVPDHNLLCLFYFNTMDKGNISIWNKNTNKQVSFNPSKGKIVLLNENNLNIFHRVEKYDKSIKRYIARFSYFVKDPYDN